MNEKGSALREDSLYEKKKKKKKTAKDPSDEEEDDREDRMKPLAACHAEGLKE